MAERNVGGADRTRGYLLMLAVLLLGFATALGATAATARAQFGAASFGTTFSTAQAGAHPDVSTSFALNTDALGNTEGQLKNMTVTLPAGFDGDALTGERCTLRKLLTLKCKSSAQIGVLEGSFDVCRGVATTLTIQAEAGATEVTVASTGGLCADAADNTITIGNGAEAETAKIAFVDSATRLILESPLEHAHAAGEPLAHVAVPASGPLPVYNLQPLPGHIATFGVDLFLTTIPINVDMRPDGRLQATIAYSSTLIPLVAATLTLWGVPGDPSHDTLRCEELGPCALSGPSPVAFTNNSTNCSAPLESELSLESWQGQTSHSTASAPAVTGCQQLRMSAGLSVLPETSQPDAPSGYQIDLEVPQEDEPYGLANANVREVSVTLPPGTSLSPALANGLQACTDTQFASSECPNAAKIGVDRISSPLLDEQLEGAIYIGAPTSSEPYRLFMDASAAGASVRITGRVEPDAATGQVTTVFSDLPQLPFDHMQLSLFGGSDAALDNPAACGLAPSTARLLAYGGQTAEPASNFTVQAPGGTCPAGLPFHPVFYAGTNSPLAGGFSPFGLTISRADGEQALSRFSAKLPPGLLGLLKSVPRCPEPQAGSGECPPGSRIGTATIGAGAGPQPLYISGPVYLTGPYDDAPFGLTTTIHATAGPFDLGTVVVRSRVLIDPTDLGLAIESNPFPQILAGVPLRMRTLNVTLDRPEFMLNPTSCAQQSLRATLESSSGTQFAAASPFQVGGCDELSFAPRLSASTEAKASREGNGASLTIEIANSASSPATIRSVKVTMPSQLRPRLTTIQHACFSPTGPPTPASCPTQSLIGRATVTTPVLAAPLSGPIYLVAHGGTQRPTLDVFLSGEGVQADVQGTLTVSRNGTIGTSFAYLPDIPISTFQMVLPRGPHSVLGAVRRLCTEPLSLPWTLADRSGRTARGDARIVVHGCVRARRSRVGGRRQ